MENFFHSLWALPIFANNPIGDQLGLNSIGLSSPVSQGGLPLPPAPIFPDDGYRQATYGGPIWGGGVYDQFRRSENIEDRRKQSYSAQLQMDEASREAYLRALRSQMEEADRNIKANGGAIFPPPQ